MLALFNLGGWELIAIGVVAVLIFGKRLPEVGRSLGQGFVEFKKGLRGVQDDVKESVDEVKDVARETRQAGADRAPKA